jgi:hypothetical protein
MALKILTGQVVPRAEKRTGGTAKISFDPHLVGGDATGGSINTIGSGRYTHTPGIVVALRDFVVKDDRSPRGDLTLQDRFRIDTGVLDRARLAVNWRCETGAQIREISYLIVGEV